jgi:hypothetical protein
MVACIIVRTGSETMPHASPQRSHAPHLIEKRHSSGLTSKGRYIKELFVYHRNTLETYLSDRYFHYRKQS